MPTFQSQPARAGLTAPLLATAALRSSPGFAATRQALKRGFDIAAAGALLLVLWPLLACVAAAIWLQDGGPVLFGHRRLGRNGRPFHCLKFRTMACDADRALIDLLAASPEARAEWAAARKLRHDPRILGATGRLLRRASLDELPQLWNVLKGEMSLVGPRPVVEAELVHYAARAAWYFATRPGLTGPWQVSGRSDLGYAARVELDVDYARNPSLRRDLCILLRTPWILLTRKGAY